MNRSRIDPMERAAQRVRDDESTRHLIAPPIKRKTVQPSPTVLAARWREMKRQNQQHKAEK